MDNIYDSFKKCYSMFLSLQLTYQPFNIKLSYLDNLVPFVAGFHSTALDTWVHVLW